MKKFFILSLAFFSFCVQAHALKVVYPKQNTVTINAPSTFFIGSVKPQAKLKVNGEDVETSVDGVFAKTVKLNYGVNNFLISSGDEKINFVITRPKIKVDSADSKSALKEYTPVEFCVKNDNAALRSIPVDNGINRLSHLPSGVKVLINGEMGNFYRVYLNDTTSGWIAKSDVEKSQISQNCIELKNYKIKKNKNYTQYEFELTGKTPFALSEDNGLNLKIFNLKNQKDNTYSFDVHEQKFVGYDVFYEENKLILKVRNPLKIDCKKPLKHIKIVIDAGHGGCESGAIGGLGDKEKDINLAIAKDLENELKSRGAKVIMIREGDYQVSLNDRVKIAKDKDADLLISIHSNALPDGQDPLKNRGTSVYYYHPQAKPLADSILSSMTSSLGTNDDRVRQRSLALVRPTSCVSVLVEVGYLINPDDYAMLLDKTFQQNCAKAIADGVEKYLLE